MKKFRGWSLKSIFMLEIYDGFYDFVVIYELLPSDLFLEIGMMGIAGLEGVSSNWGCLCMPKSRHMAQASLIPWKPHLEMGDFSSATSNNLRQ